MQSRQTSDYEYVVSPIYVYKNGNNNFTNETSALIGIETKDSPLYLIDGVFQVAKLEYADVNQPLSNLDFFDSYHLEDGKVIMVYDRVISDFKFSNNGQDVDVAVMYFYNWI